MKNITIADDQNILAQGLSNLLEATHVFKTKIVSDGVELLQETLYQVPDIIILDLNMPRLNGLEFLEKIKNTSITTNIIVLTSYNEPELIKKVKNLGAKAYLLKNTEIDEIVEVIYSLDSIKFYLGKGVKSISNDSILFNDKFPESVLLTNREKQIIKLLAQNKVPKEIAEELFISYNTIKTHRKNIYKKLNINSISELVSFTLKNEIL